MTTMFTNQHQNKAADFTALLLLTAILSFSITKKKLKTFAYLVNCRKATTLVALFPTNMKRDLYYEIRLAICFVWYCIIVIGANIIYYNSLKSIRA